MRTGKGGETIVLKTEPSEVGRNFFKSRRDVRLRRMKAQDEVLGEQTYTTRVPEGRHIPHAQLPEMTNAPRLSSLQDSGITSSIPQDPVLGSHRGPQQSAGVAVVGVDAYHASGVNLRNSRLLFAKC